MATTVRLRERHRAHRRHDEVGELGTYDPFWQRRRRPQLGSLPADFLQLRNTPRATPWSARRDEVGPMTPAASQIFTGSPPPQRTIIYVVYVRENGRDA